MKEIEFAALQAACRNLAEETLWSEQGAPEIAVAKLAGEFVAIAAVQAAGVIELCGDPGIVSRATTYLAHTHVPPSVDDAKSWFNDMLTCLVELAVPSTIQTAESAAYLLDVKAGILAWTGTTE